MDDKQQRGKTVLITGAPLVLGARRLDRLQQAATQIKEHSVADHCTATDDK